MATETLLNGEVVVCSHAAKWIRTAAAVFGVSEQEVIERCLNSYVHRWHEEFEVPIDQAHATLATTIRRYVFRGSRNG